LVESSFCGGWRISSFSVEFQLLYVYLALITVPGGGVRRGTSSRVPEKLPALPLDPGGNVFDGED
jgi:hypothetical protein